MRRTLALLAALAGAAFCALAAMGLTEAVCASGGCALFRGTSVLGVDLYWWGASYLLVMAGLIFAQGRHTGLARGLAPILTWLLLAGLAANALLLTIQVLTAPCLSCLVAAALLGATAALALPPSRLRAAALVPWGLLFVAALSGVFREQFRPVPTYGGPDAAIKVFFSPSCFACQLELQELATRIELHGHLALYPLANEAGDLQGIHSFSQEAAASGSLARAVEALSAHTPEGLSLTETARLRLVSLRNKAFLARIGAKSIPYVLTSAPGLLQAAAHEQGAPATEAQAGHNQDQQASDVLDDILGLPPANDGCGYTQKQPCADEAARNARTYSREPAPAR